MMPLTFSHCPFWSLLGRHLLIHNSFLTLSTDWSCLSYLRGPLLQALSSELSLYFYLYIFILFFEADSHYIAQAGLELMILLPQSHIGRISPHPAELLKYEWLIEDIHEWKTYSQTFWGWLMLFNNLKLIFNWVLVAYTCNSSYLGGWDQEAHSLRQLRQIVH
jgi:hypothetical protein